MTNRVEQQLGNYRPIRLLGQGGCADTYLGEHTSLKTFAAIKVLHAQLSQGDQQAFYTEARTIAHLKHPNIVRVLEFGVESYTNTPYLVMDYAPNGTLRQRHPRGIALPVSVIVPYVKQVAAGLQHAHGQKLVHRDVKPENMLLGPNNEVLLSDFGIAIIAQRYHLNISGQEKPAVWSKPFCSERDGYHDERAGSISFHVIACQEAEN